VPSIPTPVNIVQRSQYTNIIPVKVTYKTASCYKGSVHKTKSQKRTLIVEETPCL